VAASHLPAPRRNRWIRILGVAFVMYVLSYIDRTNIAMAIPAMRSELGISASAIGFATGTFFWGYPRSGARSCGLPTSRRSSRGCRPSSVVP